MTDSVSDITTFFKTSARNKNDATNTVRERVLNLLSNPPEECLSNQEFGKMWRTVHEEWKNALERVAQIEGVPAYTSTQVEVRGGRRNHYDVHVNYYNETTLVGNKKIEFKYGASKIAGLPQFLSLQAKFALFNETYDKFFYENYLSAYMACDPGITEAKPTLEVYLKDVVSTVYTISPFFAQLKARESEKKNEKNTVVNTSIKDYLTRYAKDLQINSFCEKVKATQTGKVFLLWSNGKFSIDKISEAETSDMRYTAIKNGNAIQVQSGNTTYSLLLRWRNHKGILNPAWQISMKRQ